MHASGTVSWCVVAYFHAHSTRFSTWACNKLLVAWTSTALVALSLPACAELDDRGTSFRCRILGMQQSWLLNSTDNRALLPQFSTVLLVPQHNGIVVQALCHCQLAQRCSSSIFSA